MKKQLITSCLYTVVTAVLLGLLYPMAITGLARITFPKKAAGDLIIQSGEIVGSRLIGQPFTGAVYFHGRPSAAGTGYDASSSSGSNFGPTSKALADRVAASVAADNAGSPIPVDLVTASGSGLDPDISPAAAFYQVPRIARERELSEEALQNLVQSHILWRQLGLLGEPRVNILELNMALSRMQRSSSTVLSR